MPVEELKDKLVLKHENGSSVEILWFGATVTSYKTAKGKECFFLSSKSAMDSSKPVSGMEVAEVRGGIPIVFPIFGAPPASPADYASLKQHGFARTLDWKLEKVIMDRSEGISVRLSCPAPPPDVNFNHDYKLSYVVTLAAHQLSTDLHIHNTSETQDFKFQALLHNYLAVEDVSKIKISGLDKGVEYADKVLNFKRSTWEGGDLTIEGEVDRVHEQVPSKEIHVDDGAGSGYKVRFRGFEDCTIWNPGQEKAAGIADMEDGGWKKYVCIEPGYVREFKTLKAGEEFLGQQILVPQ